ncbi:NRPS [Myotisia sp. PD_48]|nr:NRPS [Myotisia sp. PD_48]
MSIMEENIKEFWHSQLIGRTAPSFPTLPSATYCPTPSAQCQLKILLPENVERGFKLSSAVRLGWAIVLSHFVNSKAILFGSNLSDHGDLLDGTPCEKQFITLPFHISVDGNQSASDSMVAIQDQLLKMAFFRPADVQKLSTYFPDSGTSCIFQNQLIVINSDASACDALSVVSQTGTACALSIICHVDNGLGSVHLDVVFDAEVIAKETVQSLLRDVESTLHQLIIRPSEPLIAFWSTNEHIPGKLQDRNLSVAEISTTITNSIPQKSRANHLNTEDIEVIENHTRSFFPKAATVAVELVTPIEKPSFLAAFVCQQEVYQGVEAEATISVNDVGIAGKTDEIQMLANGDGISSKSNSCIQAIFGEVWLEQLGATAVTGWDGSFTYWELEELSTSLARHLMIDYGVLGGESVFICSEKSRWTIVAILAVVKTGAVFTLIDPSWEIKQLHRMCQQVSCRLIIASLQTAQMSLNLVDQVVITGDYSYWNSSDAVMIPLPKVTADQPVFKLFAFDSASDAVITTVNHRSFLEHTLSFIQRVEAHGSARWLQWTAYSSWVSVLEIFCAILSGASLCIPEEIGGLDEFAEAVASLEATHTCLTTPLALDLQLEKIRQLEKLVVLGEVSESRLSNLWSDFQLYKPSELQGYNSNRSLRDISPKNLLTRHNWKNGVSVNQTFPLLGILNTEFWEQARSADLYLRHDDSLAMVPSVYIPISSVTSTTVSIVDRQCLCHMVLSLSDDKLREFSLKEHSKPENKAENEAQLREIWSKTLGLRPEGIGAEDNFLYLGGDSVTAMRAAAAARDMGLNLTVPDILNNPKLVAQAAITASRSPYVHRFKKEAFSLVNASIKERVCEYLEQLGLPSDVSAVVDIAPVTEGQLFFLKQWTPSHYCQFYDNILDIDRLRAACETVVSNLSILRTAFVYTDEGVFQAVLKDPPLPFHHFTTDDDLALYCDSMWQDDSELGSELGKMPLKFTLVSRSSTEHVLVIRLSHAQFDGLSLPVLFRDLVAEYNQPRSSSPGVDFLSYVYFMGSQNHDIAFRFWREYLRGSTVTNMPPLLNGADPGSLGKPQRITTGQSIAIPNPPPGMTVATVVKAAAAFVLSKFTGRTDLVLGQAVNARTMPLPGIEKILGGCMNMIPLRLTVQQDCTILDLLEHVQKQSVLTFEHDYLGFRRIVQNCTDWAETTQFGCVVQHQNIGPHPTLHLGDAQGNSSSWAHFIPVSGIWILSDPQPSHLQIMICSSKQVISLETMQFLRQQICTTIDKFTEDPTCRLDTIDGNGSSRYPV